MATGVLLTDYREKTMDFRNILVPVDFSPESMAVVSHVKAMASLFDSTVFLFHVDTESDSRLSDAPPSPSVHKLAEMAGAGFNGFTVVPTVRQGDPATEIVKFAQTRDIGLIMMPTHGAGRFRAALLGSVAAKVLSDASCSVWTSAQGHNDQTTPARQIRSIPCAIDLGPESRILIRATDSLGARTGAKVRLVHAVPGEETEPLRALNVEFDRYPNEDESRSYPPDKTTPPLCQWSKDCARIAAARLQRETGTAFDLCLQVGRPSRVIQAVALHHQADLVIAGRGHNNGLAGYLRTEVYSIVRDSPCPVLRF
jgi:nucleotide-binding universal stress UspA family protein